MLRCGYISARRSTASNALSQAFKTQLTLILYRFILLFDGSPFHQFTWLGQHLIHRLILLAQLRCLRHFPRFRQSGCLKGMPGSANPRLPVISCLALLYCHVTHDFRFGLPLDDSKACREHKRVSCNFTAVHSCSPSRRLTRP